MNIYSLLKPPSPLHLFDFCFNHSTEKSIDIKSNPLSSSTNKSLSRKANKSPSTFFISRTQRILQRNKSSSVFQSSSKMNSVIACNKDKLTAFNTLIDDLYHNNQSNKPYTDRDFRLIPSQSVPKVNFVTSFKPVIKTIQINKQSSPISSPSLSLSRFNASLIPMTVNKASQTQTPSRALTRTQARASSPNINTEKLLQANVGSSYKKRITLVPCPDIFNNKKRLRMNRFILKVLDPEACLEDYTPDKGTSNTYFNHFKKKLNQEKQRLSNLLYNNKLTEARNKDYLKFYSVKLRNAESKNYQIPRVKSIKS